MKAAILKHTICKDSNWYLKCLSVKDSVFLIVPNLPDLILELPGAQFSDFFFPIYIYVLSDFIQSPGFKYYLYADDLPISNPA